MYKRRPGFSRAIHANRNEALLIFRIGTQLVDRQRIVKDAFRVGKGNAVLRQIARSLCWIELEAHIPNCMHDVHTRQVRDQKSEVSGQWA